MSTRTSIEWTELSWNPTTGCTKISPGCKNCYAEVMANRLKAMGVKGYENGFNLNLQHFRLTEPLKRKKPSIYFVNSMSDLFHEEIPDSFVSSVMKTIQESPSHIFQILTKRAERMFSFFRNIEVPANAWLGVSVEDKNHGLPRIKYLQEIKSTVKFVSMEPLLENLCEIDISNIDWVIVGGESGHKARMMKKEWVIDIKEKCKNNRIPFFFKQWGGINKRKNGRTLDGKTWDDFPQLYNRKSYKKTAA